ncbi:MAG: flagellar protein FlgN [Bacteroidota bacterium]
MSPNIQNSIDALAAVLRKESKAAAMMEQLIRQKQQAFIKWHSGDLEVVVAEEEGILSTMSLLEKERIALIKLLSRNQPKLLTMKELLALYPSDELFSAYNELKDISSRVIRYNNQNRHLVQSSLSFVRKTMGFITGNFRYKLLDQKV